MLQINRTTTFMESTTLSDLGFVPEADGGNALLTGTYSGERFCVKLSVAIHKNERSCMCQSEATCYAFC